MMVWKPLGNAAVLATRLRRVVEGDTSPMAWLTPVNAAFTGVNVKKAKENPA
jgi:hypothetical protein